MKRLIASLILFLSLTTIAVANDSFIYLQMEKVTNGSYEYKLPAIEWSIQQAPFILDLELSETYTAPRSDASQLNHGCITLNPNFGIQRGNLFATASIGLRYYIAGNSWGIPASTELFNTVRVGVKF